jgi:hypothetical protein
MNNDELSKLAAVLVENQGLFAALPACDRRWIIENGDAAMTLFIESILRRSGREELIEVSQSVGYTRLISADEDIVIDQTNGRGLLSVANDLFVSIDRQFKDPKVNEFGMDTDETCLDVYEIVRPANLLQLFSSISEDVRMLYLTQSQIRAFLSEYSNWLNVSPYPTFFLFKSSNVGYVAQVNVLNDKKLSLRLNELDSEFIWNLKKCPRVVVPRMP